MDRRPGAGPGPRPLAAQPGQRVAPPGPAARPPGARLGRAGASARVPAGTGGAGGGGVIWIRAEGGLGARPVAGIDNTVVPRSWSLDRWALARCALAAWRHGGKGRLVGHGDTARRKSRQVATQNPASGVVSINPYAGRR